MTDRPGTFPKYYLIDAFRGFALLNMLFFHFFYDVFIIFRQDPGWYDYPWVHVWQQFICMSFLFISGISWHFSRNNLKRGLLLNVYGLVITAVTLVFMPSQAVLFGILNCIGCLTLLMIPLDRLIKRLKCPNSALTAVIGMTITLLLFLLTRGVNDGYIGIGAWWEPLPDWLYTFPPMTILGFPYPGFTSSDYFSILPWFFLFLAGYWFWELTGHWESLRKVFHMRIPFFSDLGRKTIWIYILHQPLLYGASYLLIRILGVTF